MRIKCSGLLISAQNKVPLREVRLLDKSDHVSKHLRVWSHYYDTQKPFHDVCPLGFSLHAGLVERESSAGEPNCTQHHVAHPDIARRGARRSAARIRRRSERRGRRGAITRTPFLPLTGMSSNHDFIMSPKSKTHSNYWN